MSLTRAALPCLLALVLAAPPVAGSAPVLVGDVDPHLAGRKSPTPADLGVFQGQAVFTVLDGGWRRTLWASDGTPAGTRRLSEELQAVYGVLGEAAGGLVVLAIDSFLNPRFSLWRVDLAGRVERLLPPGVDPLSATLLSFDGLYYFFATPAPTRAKYYNPPTPTSLWRTDGTAAGTREVAPVGAGRFTVGPVVFRGRLYFFVGQRGEDEPDLYFSLWASDGRSAAGTEKIADLESASVELFLVPAARRLLFPAEARRGEELWGSDGTAAGTFPLTDFPAEQPFSSGYVRPTPAGGRLYFFADDGVHGRELWASDGTGRGTERLTELAGEDPFVVDDYGSVAIADAGPGVLFAADDGVHGRELWRSAGTAASTALAADLCPGTCHGFERPGPARDGKLYFAGHQPGTGTEAWVSDGTAAGTVALADLCPGSCSTDVAFTEIGDRVALLDPREGASFALFAADGSSAGTELLVEADLLLLSDSPRPFARLGRRLLFFAADDDSSAELWAATVPNRGLAPVADFAREQPASSNPVDLTAAGGKVFFVGCDAGRPRLFATSGDAAAPLLDLENDCVNFYGSFADDTLLAGVGGRAFLAYLDLWVSDGTPEGTVNLTRFDYLPTAYPTVFSNVVDFGGRAAFAVIERVDDAGGYHERLWLSDGTPEGTQPTDALPQPLAVSRLFSLGGKLYFWGSDAEGTGFWASDGTAGGTDLLHRLSRFLQVPEEPPVEALGAVYFTTGDPFPVLGLWRTDGTPGGTEEVILRPQHVFGQYAQGLTAMGGALFLVAAVGQDGDRELWRTDGTQSGTERLGSLGLGHFDRVTGPVAAGGKLFLLAAGSESSRLWVSDGIAAGTRAVGPAMGSFNGFGVELVAVGERVFLSAHHDEHGRELWTSDGTDAGTHLAADIAPGKAASEPRGLAVAGSDLYLSADDGLFGREPWRLPGAPSAPGCAPSPVALCLAGGRLQATLAWRAEGGAPQRAAARSLALDSGGFSFAAEASLEVVAKALDATAIDGHLWAFAGSLTDASWELTLRDGETGGARRWANLLHQQTALADLHAFPASGLPAAEGAVRVLEESGPALAGRRDATLAPALTPAPPCQPAPGVLCLQGGRFRVEVGREGAPFAATVLPWSDLAGAFALAPGANADLAVKILDATAVNGRFWVFATALTDRAYLLTVTDTVTGAQRTYAKPAGTLAGVADLAAF